MPTRCPACKGSLIQRIPKPSYGASVSFHCLFCKNIWKVHLEDPCVSPTGRLTGELFVITRRRIKHKLASVAVSAISEEVLEKHLKSKTMQRELESQNLQRDIDDLTATLAIAEAEDQGLWEILKRDEQNAQKAVAWSDAYRKVKDVTRRIESLQAQRQRLASEEYFFDGLPSGIVTTTTDANGKFAMTLPRQGRFGVVARASRELFKSTETYLWLVWVGLEGESEKHLTLNNDNMVRAVTSEPHPDARAPRATRPHVRRAAGSTRGR